MSPIRLLSICLIAFALPALGQTPQRPAPRATPQISKLDATNNPLLRIPTTNAPALTAQLNAPCAMIRSYGFSDRDLHSFNPRPSTYSTCTPATSGKVLQVQLPAKATPVK